MESRNYLMQEIKTRLHWWCNILEQANAELQHDSERYQHSCNSKMLKCFLPEAFSHFIVSLSLLVQFNLYFSRQSCLDASLLLHPWHSLVFLRHSLSCAMTSVVSGCQRDAISQQEWWWESLPGGALIISSSFVLTIDGDNDLIMKQPSLNWTFIP